MVWVNQGASVVWDRQSSRSNIEVSHETKESKEGKSKKKQIKER